MSFRFREIAAVTLIGCSGAAPPAAVTKPTATAAAVPSPPPSAALAPGVLAQAQGLRGLIVVEERDGLRRLRIGDQVHAAVGAHGGPDPAVAIARAMRPGAKRALIIGLGSGKTAGDFIAAGFDVVAVELEPKVIEFARRYFGYQGRAIAADGAVFLRDDTDMAFDVVLMDAYPTIDDAWLLLHDRVRARKGVVLTRLLMAPAAKALRDLRDKTGVRDFLALGTGIGGEKQNVIVATSDDGLSIVDVEGINYRPISLDQVPTRKSPSEIMGYLIRLPDGDLALDLPHHEMGAVRYVLTGKTQRLEQALGKIETFPTEGDIGSDGDTTVTLKEVFGGGGVKRNETRFSPVAAAVVGSARLVSQVHPDRASMVPKSVRGDGPTDARIPYGGVLYELTVGEVRWTLDMKAYQAAKAKLAHKRRRALAELLRGKLAAAADNLTTYVDELAGAIKTHDVPMTTELRRVASALRDRTGQQAGNRCDLAYFDLGGIDWNTSASWDFSRAARRCAIAFYETIERSGVDAKYAANRLVTLYTDDGQLKKADAVAVKHGVKGTANVPMDLR